MYALTSKKWQELREAEEDEKKSKKTSKKGVEKGKGKKGDEKGKGKKEVEKGKGKKEVEKGKGKKGDEKGIGKKRAEKQGMIDQKDEDDSGGDWKCMVCDSSFFQQEEDEVECKWVQCQKCDETSHVTCIPQVHRIYFSFESEDEEVCLNCINLAEDSDNYM